MHLALPAPQPTDGWAAMARLVLDSVSSAHTKRAYSKALQDFFGWYGRSGQTAPVAGRSSHRETARHRTLAGRRIQPEEF